jgi:ABC-2 type transport system permease protein
MSQAYCANSNEAVGEFQRDDPRARTARRTARRRLASLSRIAAIFDFELRSQFRRTSTYVLLLAAVLTAAWSFSWLVTFLARGGPIPRPADEPITQFVGPNVFLIGLCTLLVPLVTMSLVADERRRGTWELLLTAPVSIGDALLAKFLCGWCLLIAALAPWFCFLAMLRLWNGRTRVLWGFVPWFDGSGIPFDFGAVLGAAIGLATIGGTFVAIGTFWSSLCRRPAAAALLTFVSLAAMVLLAILPRVLEIWGFAREQTAWIETFSCWGQLERFSQGLLLPRVVIGHLSIWVALLATASRVAQRVDEA